jgi:hypothetical protein
MRYFWVLILILTACSDTPTTHGKGRYNEVGGSNVLLFNEQLGYLGNKDVPTKGDLLVQLGTPIEKHDSSGIRCVKVAGIVLAVSDSNQFECLGLVFRSIPRTIGGERKLRAVCGAFAANGACTESKGKPAMQYDIEIDRNGRIEAIEFISDDPRNPGSVLKHAEGPKLP